MTKRLFSLLTALLLAAVLVIPASAAVADSPRIDDMADLLSAEQEQALTAKLRDYSEAQNCDIVFVTTPDLSTADFSFNGTAVDFADRYYETHGYAADGVLVLITLESENGRRNITFSCSGKCMKRLSDDEQNELLDAVLYDSYSDDIYYYKILDKIADGINRDLTPRVKWYLLPLSLGIGFAIAMLIMTRLRNKLKSVSMQRGAASYVRPGSMNVTASRDTYLYSTVSRTEKPKNDSDSGRTSSGGGSHSGVSRDF